MIRTLTLTFTAGAGAAAMVASSFGAFGPTVLAQQPAAPPIIATPGTTEVLTIETGTIRILVEGKQTNGAVTVVEGVVEPGHCVPVHTHAYAESFHILEGTMTLQTADATRQLAAGDYVYVPPKVPHGFCNKGQTPFRNILTATPSGIEAMFRRRAEESKKAQAQPQP